MTLREQARAYLNDALPLLNLKQWTVKVSDDLPPDDAWADIEASTNLWEATIRVSNDLFKEKPEKQRQILAHELMHLHYASVERVVDTLEHTLGSQAYEIIEKVWDVETERAADAISCVVDKLLPLPEFKEKEDGIRTKKIGRSSKKRR